MTWLVNDALITKLGVTCSATKIDQSSFRQDDDGMTSAFGTVRRIAELELVYLRLDLYFFNFPCGHQCFQVSHVDFIVKVANITHDRIVFHFSSCGRRE